jgi:EmrB/QacA subfamily drug resistance transporter
MADDLVTPAPTPRASWLERLRTTPNYRLTALIVACAMFMEHFDATVLATAVPTIARDFGTPAVNLSSAITAYLLALAIFIPVSGWLADRFGLRNVFRGAMVIFVGSSVLCAFSWSIASLTAARFLQGFGGALMVPVGRLAILRVARKDQIMSAMAWLLVPMLIGPIMGPPLGGLIVTHLNWQWIFFINVPIGAVGVVLISLFIPNSRGEQRQPLDWKGFCLTALTLGSLLFGFEGASRGDELALSLALIVVGLVAGALYFRHATRTKHPLLDLSLFNDRSYRLSVSGGSLARITQGAQSFLIPLLFQVGLGMNADVSGALILSVAVGALAAKAVISRLMRRFGFRNVMTLNGVIISVLYASWGFIRGDWSDALIVILLGVSGFFMSIQFTAYNTIAFESIEQARMSNASTFYFTLQQVMLSLGVCAGALALRSSSALFGHGDPRPIDFTFAFVAVCCITAGATFVHLRFPPNAGAALTGQSSGTRENESGPA